MPNSRGIVVLVTALLVAVGVLMVFSASMTSRPTGRESVYLNRHLTSVGIGLVAALVASRLPVRFWTRFSAPLFLVSCILLLAVLIPGVGSRVNGANRWFRVGSISFQPSELAKIALVLFLAQALCRRKTDEEEAAVSTTGESAAAPARRAEADEDELEEDDADNEEDSDDESEGDFDELVEEDRDHEDLDEDGPDGSASGAKLKRRRSLLATRLSMCRFPLLLAVFLTSALVMLEPDFGTALFLAAVGLLLMFVGGASLKKLALVGVLGLPLVGLLLWQKPYRMRRVYAVVQAWTDLSEAPYHVRQSLLTLGSGGLWGTGLGKGWQKLSFLPEPNTDFVFAVIGEELGLVGTLTVVALWTVFLMAGLRMLRQAAHDRFSYLAAFGLLMQLVLQAAINMAVVTALLPPKGIPLPFVSYGGSSLTMSLLAIGIMAGLCRGASNPAEAEIQVRLDAVSQSPKGIGGPHLGGRHARARRKWL